MEREDNNKRSTKKAKTAPAPLGLLDSLESQLKKQQKIVQSVKNTLRAPDPPYVDIMVTEMLSLCELEYKDDAEDAMIGQPRGTPESNSKKTEFEIRIGKTNNSKFLPGITMTNFLQYKAQLDEDSEMACEETRTMLYYYDLPGGNGNIRVEVENEVPVRSQTKKRLGNYTDVDNIYALPYDIRFSISSETEQPPPADVPSDHKLTRYKTRWSFYKPDAPYSWRTDMTEVRTVHNGHQTETVNYEIEFDFNEDVIDACRRMDKGLLRQISTHFWDFAVRLLNGLHKSGSSHFPPSLHLEKVTDEETLRNLRETALNFIDSTITRIGNFPGSMPVNFTEKSVPLVTTRKYWVSEKTDGIRAMLVINPRDAVYIVDRKFDFYALPDYECLLNLYSSDGVTVLDGEIVTHLTTGKIMYLVFDITALNGQTVYSLPLEKRLAYIQKVVIKYRDPNNQHLFQNPPFEIIGKTFLQKSQISKLLSHITEDKGHGRIYKDDKRHHKSDGIIFTPDDPYKTYTAPNLFKYKYEDEMSIDLKLTLVSGNLHFACAVDRTVDIDYPIQVIPEDYQRLSRYATHTLKDPKAIVIVEMVYDYSVQKWKLKMVRTDKDRANNVRVVTDTVNCINEHISTNDLKKFCAAKP